MYFLSSQNMGLIKIQRLPNASGTYMNISMYKETRIKI
jgi:hypothetical protein